MGWEPNNIKIKGHNSQDNAHSARKKSKPKQSQGYSSDKKPHPFVDNIQKNVEGNLAKVTYFLPSGKKKEIVGKVRGINYERLHMILMTEKKKVLVKAFSKLEVIQMEEDKKKDIRENPYLSELKKFEGKPVIVKSYSPDGTENMTESGKLLGIQYNHLNLIMEIEEKVKIIKQFVTVERQRH